MLAVALVAMNWIITPLYHDGSDHYPVWAVVNGFMAFAVALIVNYSRQCALPDRGADGAITREYLEVNLAFYGSILLAAFFYSNWFSTFDTSRVANVAKQAHDL